MIEVANVETLKILDKEGKETVQNTSELNLPDLDTIEKTKSNFKIGEFIITEDIKPQKLKGTKKKDVLVAISRRDTLLGGAGKDRLIGAVTDDPLKSFDDEGNFLSTRFFDGPGNDLIKPKEGYNFIVLGRGRNKLILPNSEFGRHESMSSEMAKTESLTSTALETTFSLIAFKTCRYPPSKTKRRPYKMVTISSSQRTRFSI